MRARFASARPRHRPPLVLVTGASQGIGAEIALAFAREAGARLALVARQTAKLRAVAKRCFVAGASAAEFFPCDCAAAAATDAMSAAVRATLGEPDVVVANAGHFSPAALLEMDAAAFDAVLGANLRSAFLTARTFAPAMAARGRGDLFFMASVAALRGFPRGGAYVAAKHGVLGLARAFREELRGRGVRVMAVLPGATVSPSWKGSGVPAERMMPAADVARAFVDLWRMSPRTVAEELLLRPAAGDV